LSSEKPTVASRPPANRHRLLLQLAFIPSNVLGEVVKLRALLRGFVGQILRDAHEILGKLHTDGSARRTTANLNTEPNPPA
jgi:hypothetical protein